MTTHIGAVAGAIAPRVLMPGDPLRARWIAETFLEGPVLHNEVRGMLGYTGTWQGHEISVMGSGMGQPSLAIYVNELFMAYDVESIIRVGSCGGLAESVKMRDVVLATGACTNSAMNRLAFDGLDYAPVADFGLLRAAYDAGMARGDTTLHTGLIFSSDSFYNPRSDLVDRMVEYGVLAVEMEASALYTLAAKYGRRALAICTVSDEIPTGLELPAQDRERTFSSMVEIALAAITA